MNAIFFDGWQTLLRTATIGVLGYVALIVLLRISGKRTLSKLNAFDFIVTVALGSTLASMLTSQQTPLAQGVLALGLLVGLQAVVTWLSVRWPWLRAVVASEPTLLVHRGVMLQDALRRQRVTESEIREALRQHGVTRLADAEAVVLESDGSLSVLPEARFGDGSSLRDVDDRDALS